MDAWYMARKDFGFWVLLTVREGFGGCYFFFFFFLLLFSKNILSFPSFILILQFSSLCFLHALTASNTNLTAINGSYLHVPQRIVLILQGSVGEILSWRCCSLSLLNKDNDTRDLVKFGPLIYFYIQIFGKECGEIHHGDRVGVYFWISFGSRIWREYEDVFYVFVIPFQRKMWWWCDALIFPSVNQDLGSLLFSYSSPDMHTRSKKRDTLEYIRIERFNSWNWNWKRKDNKPGT